MLIPLEGGDYFKYFRLRGGGGGGYSRAAIQDRGNDSFQPKTPMNY